MFVNNLIKCAKFGASLSPLLAGDANPTLYPISVKPTRKTFLTGEPVL
jgi:hypothetical protein